MLAKLCLEFNIGQRVVHLSPLALLIGCLGLGVLLSLSVWQYRRGIEKQQSITQFEQAPLVNWHRGETVKNHQHVQIQGRFINQQQFLLDNQFYRHRFGYHVLTPLLLSSGDVILVDRGYVASSADRQTLPQIASVDGQLNLRGRVHQIQRNRFISAHVIDNPGRSPLVIEQVNFAMIAAILKMNVVPWILWLDPEQPHGFIRDWHVVTMTPARHFGYAFQWFMLALGFLIAMIAANTRKNHV